MTQRRASHGVADRFPFALPELVRLADPCFNQSCSSSNEIYEHYWDVSFHPTKLSEPPHTRSELERALKLPPSPPENLADAASWLEGFAPAWLRGEAEAEPFPQNHQANEHWRATQRSPQEQRETTLRKLVVGTEEAGNSNHRFER